MSIKFNFNKIRTASMIRASMGAGMGGIGGMGFGGGNGGFGFGGTGSRFTQNSFNPVYDDLSEGTIIEQFMPVDPRRLNRIWRRIKLQDPVAGPAIDLYAELPWSEFQLIGVQDRTIIQTYTDALNNIAITSYLPELSGEFLAMGKIIGHLIMNESKGIWERMIIHDPDWIRVTPIPIPGFQPKLDIIPTPSMRQWAHSQDPRDIDAQEDIADLVRLIRSGADIPLPPENTFYIPRRAAPYDVIGASIYTRILMFVAYEKALVNATIASSRRRASRIRHVAVGIDDVWEPSREELDDHADLFIRADSDPVGAVVATRTGVTVNEVGGSSPQDIVKISDEWDFLLRGKLNALGVSEAFLTGEATFQTLEQILSVFLEKVKAHRKFFEHALIYENLLKPLAKKHGFVHRKQAELDHRVRIARSESESKYILPTLAWEKSLRPVADRDYLEILQMMEEKGIPIAKRTWAASAGFDLDSEMQQFDDDLEVTRQLAAQKKKIMQIAPEAAGAPGGAMGGDTLGGLGGDLGGGLGGGLDLGGGGMDLGGGGMGDLGGLGGGAPGGPEAGGGAGGPLELPQIGASVRTAAALHAREDRQTLNRLYTLPIWGKKSEFMGVSMDSAELATRRILDSLGDRYSRNLSKTDVRRIMSTGNHRRDQVLRYLLAYVGVIRNADISRDIAGDIEKELRVRLGDNPQELRQGLQVVLACVKASTYKQAAEESMKDAEYKKLFEESMDTQKLSKTLKNVISDEKAHVKGNSLLTGYTKE